MPEIQNWEEISLEAIGEAGAIKQVNYQLKKIIENIRDPNTEAQAVRTVTLKITLKPDADRKGAEIAFKTEAKLAGDMPGADRVVISPSSGKGYINTMEQLDLIENEPRLVPKSGGDA